MDHVAEFWWEIEEAKALGLLRLRGFEGDGESMLLIVRPGCLRNGRGDGSRIDVRKTKNLEANKLTSVGKEASKK